jgi:hypothetical protein
LFINASDTLGVRRTPGPPVIDAGSPGSGGPRVSPIIYDTLIYGVLLKYASIKIKKSEKNEKNFTKGVNFMTNIIPPRPRRARYRDC